jgi:hypothetical protein
MASDLRTFSSSFDVETSNLDISLITDIKEQFKEFMQSFTNVILFAVAQDIGVSDQDSLKSTFKQRFADFIQRFNQLKADFILEETLSISAEEIGDSEFDCTGDETHTYKWVFCGRSIADNVFYNSRYADGYDETWRDAFFGETFDGNTIYNVYIDELGGYVVSKAVADLTRSTSASETTQASINQVVRSMMLFYCTQDRDVDVDVDLLEEKFPAINTLRLAIEEVLASLDLSE